jgi:OmpA-OmpF porin, OOP family
MRLSRFVVCLLSAVAIFTFASTGEARTTGTEASFFHPTIDGGPYFSLYGSEALGQTQWTFGTMANYSYRPFQYIQNGQRVRGIVDHDLTQDFTASVGLIGRWLTLGIDVPVGWWLKFIDPNVTDPTPQNKIVMGDVELAFKSEFVELQEHRIGFAVLPFITLPTGDGKYFNGAGNVTGGGKLILEFLPYDRWHIALNVGTLFREKFVISNIEEHHQLLYGVGTAVDIIENLSAAFEVTGRAKLTGLFAHKEESPLEGDAGVKYAFGDSGFSIMGGGGAGFIRGAGAPTYRLFLGMSYRSKGEEAAPSGQ